MNVGLVKTFNSRCRLLIMLVKNNLLVGKNKIGKFTGLTSLGRTRIVSVHELALFSRQETVIQSVS